MGNRGRTTSHSVEAVGVREIWFPNLLFQILDHSAFKNAEGKVGFENETYAGSSTVHKAKVNIYLLISMFMFLVSIEKLVLTNLS